MEINKMEKIDKLKWELNILEEELKYKEEENKEEEYISKDILDEIEEKIYNIKEEINKEKNGDK